MKRMLTLAVLAAALTAQAKTIALWPMELDPDTSAFYGTNVIHAANHLSLVEGSSTAGLDWALPSNPDASAMTFSPLNRGTAIAGSRSGSARYATRLSPLPGVVASAQRNSSGSSALSDTRQ